MRTFNISFLAVLSCIAMIGATPIVTHSRSLYVAFQHLTEVLT